MKTSTVLVLGANGRLGLAAAQAFAAAGWQVLAQVRRHPDPAMPAGAQILSLDYADTPALLAAAELVGKIDVVVHGLNPEYRLDAWKRDAMPMLEAGIALARALDALLLYPGSVYNFGEGMPPVLREDTPVRPSNGMGAIRCQLEQRLQDAAVQGLRSAVIRAGDFYGVGEGTWIDLLIAKELRQGRLVYPGQRHLIHSWAYLPDVGRCFVAVAEQRHCLPTYSNLHFAGHSVTGEELLNALEAAAHNLGLASQRPAKRGGFPWAAVRVVGLVNPLYRALSSMSYLWRVPHALEGANLSALIGEVPATPLVESMTATLLAMGVGDEGRVKKVA